MMLKLNISRTCRFNIARLTVVTVAVAACYMTTANFAAAQTINGCADKNTGSLRRIVPPAVCKSGETVVNWNATGPQGIQGPTGAQGIQGPQGIQGEPGTSGVSARLITVATGVTDFEIMSSCSDPIRTKEFIKQSDTSKLRITYHDNAYVQSPTNTAAFDVEVRIDGLPIGPTPMENGIDGGPYGGSDVFTNFGYAYGIASGSHTLTSRYKFTILPPLACIRYGGYTIEIEEIQ